MFKIYATSIITSADDRMTGGLGRVNSGTSMVNVKNGTDLLDSTEIVQCDRRCLKLKPGLIEKSVFIISCADI